MNEQQQPGQNKTCFDAGELIAWRDGALSQSETEKVTAHLAGCARCTAEERALMRDSRQLFDLLSTLDPLLASRTETEAALARFQQRFSIHNVGSVQQYDGDLDQEELPLIESEWYHPPIPKRSSTRLHRLGALVQTLAAVLVVAALIGSSLLLLRARVPATGDHSVSTLRSAPPIGPVGAPVKVSTKVGGLDMTMQITPGPYFLSEMLRVDLSLSNHTNSTFLLQEQTKMDGTSNKSCPPPLKIVMAVGDHQSDSNLQNALAATISCNSSLETVQLQPAQTITSYQYIALTVSGPTTIIASATFQKTALQDGVIQIVPDASPLQGHRPSLQIMVQAGVPSDRLISFYQQNTLVNVIAPPAARGRLLYMSVFDCDLGGGQSQHNGTEYWISLRTMTIQKPQCGYSTINGTPTPGKILRWTYVVSAPGFAIVLGKYPS